LSLACPPLFIVGLGRSGSTLVARMIDAHPEVAIFPETHMYAALDFVNALQVFRNSWQYTVFLNEVWANLVGYSDPAAAVWANYATRQPRYTGPTRKILEELGTAYASTRNARLWGEKTPGHALWLEDIQKLFPAARIIFTVRDPRDVLVSYCERWNGGRFDPRFVMESAANIRYHIDRLLRAPAFPSQQIRWLKYESLTADPEHEMRETCRFLSLDFYREMLEFHQSHQNVERETPDGVHHKLLSRPVSRERVGTFRRAFSPSLLNLVEDFLGSEMTALGYSIEGTGAALHSWEEQARQLALRRYEEIASGKMRHEQRVRMNRKIWLYRCFGRSLAFFQPTRLAVSRQDWSKRAASLAVGAMRFEQEQAG
jgi:Sulfotransferase family